MSGHPFNFDGGSELSDIGASCFVSYAYYTHIDKTHQNWKNVVSYPSRIEGFRSTTHYHKYWLEKVLEMNEKKLNTNKILLKASRTKEMARQLLESGAV
jgi:hypothetical protein